MKRFAVALLVFVGAMTLLGAATSIFVTQIRGAGTGTFVIESVNGVVSWATLPSSTVPSFSDAETPGGTINGTNAVFTLARADANTGQSLVLTRNGIVQQSGEDYTLTIVGTSGTLTFVTASIPQTGDSLQAWYRY
jgi:hypothetical protein